MGEGGVFFGKVGFCFFVQIVNFHELVSSCVFSLKNQSRKQYLYHLIQSPSFFLVFFSYFFFSKRTRKMKA